MSNLKDRIRLYLVLVAFAMAKAQTTTFVDEGHWKTIQVQLSQMIGQFRQTCEIRGKSLPAVRKDEVEALEGCVRPEFNKLKTNFNSKDAEAEQKSDVTNAIIELKNGNSIEPNQVDALTKSLATPMCSFVPALIKCIKPHLIRSRELCKPDTVGVTKTLIEYIEVMVKSTCRNNGRLIIEFLATGGMYCADLFRNHATECFKNSNVLLEDRDTITTTEMCNSLGIIHDCLDSNLNSCEKKRPPAISKSVLDEVKPWLSTCLISGGKLNHAGSVVMIVYVSTYFILRVLMSLSL